MGRTFRTMSTQTLMPRHVHRDNKDPLPRYAHADPLQAHRGPEVPFKLRLYLTVNLTLTLALTLALADDVQLHVPSLGA